MAKKINNALELILKNKTLTCVFVIVVLSICQKYFELKIDDTYWKILFASALGFLRMGMNRK